jgi:transposase
VTTTRPIPTDTPLPEDLAACHAMIQLERQVRLQLAEQLDGATRRIAQMEHRLEQLLRRIYGRSAEKLDPSQKLLFLDLLKQLQPEDPFTSPPMPPTITPPKSSNGHGRRRIPEDLPRKRVVHDLPEEEKPCPCCGKMREIIGEETREQLDYEPAKLSVIQHVRLKYVCRSCEEKAAEGGPQIIVAEKPLSPIEKGLAAPGLLAYLIVSKYSDHLPLHRLERILARHHIDLARSTMCDWMRQSAEALEPLYNLMVRQALESRVLHTDDTPVDVLDRQLPETRTGRFWVYVGDRDHPCTVFAYTPNRSRDGPMTFLKDWGKDGRRYLQADAFGGYDGIYAGEAGGNVTEVACWAHARRKFYEARTTDSNTATRALAYIRLLYDVEDQAKGMSSAERLALRQSQAVPRLNEFKMWLESRQATSGGSVLPKSAMGQAITYALNQWDALNIYTTDGDLSIDNNAAENALRRVAIGRKNWLFCGSDNGGHTAAVLFSLIASCDRHNVDPFAYLRDVLTRLAAHPMHRLADLLPGNWQN